MADPNRLIPSILRSFGPFHSLLDVGSASSIVGLGYWEIPDDKVWSIDIWPPEVPWRNFKLLDAFYAAMHFGPKSFDVVQAAELIEHVQKDRVQELLLILESVARRAVVLTTPNGFLEQDPEKCPHEPWAKNPYQKHLSGWSAVELNAFGYESILNNPQATETQIIAWKLLS